MSRKGQQTDEDKTGDSRYTFQQQRELFEMQIALEREKAKLSVEAAKETADAQYKVLQMQIELERQKQFTEHNNRINPAQFRSCVRRQNDSYADHSVYLLNQFERWVNSMQVAESYDNLKQLMLVEQFMNKISDDLREHLIDKGCHTLQDCARKADEYIALHKSMKHGQRSSNNA